MANGFSSIPKLREYAVDVYSWKLLGPNGSELDVGPAPEEAEMDCVFADSFLNKVAVRNLARRNVFAGSNIRITECSLVKTRYRGPGYFVETCGSLSLSTRTDLHRTQVSLEDSIRAERAAKAKPKDGA